MCVRVCVCVCERRRGSGLGELRVDVEEGGGDGGLGGGAVGAVLDQLGVEGLEGGHGGRLWIGIGGFLRADSYGLDNVCWMIIILTTSMCRIFLTALRTLEAIVKIGRSGLFLPSLIMRVLFESL